MYFSQPYRRFVSLRVLKVGFAAALAFSTLTGCDHVFDKAPATVQSPSPYIGFQTKCLTGALPVIQGFMNGTASPAEVSAVWQCFGNAITVFQKKVRGANQDQFTAREVADFFEIYFFKDLKLSNELLTQIMYIKQLVVGGANDKITRDELTKLINFSHKMNTVSLNVLPYMKVYSMNWQTQPSDNIQDNIAYFEKANEAIQDAAKSLAELVTENDQNYSIANVAGLLHAIQPLYGANWPWLDQLDQAMPLLQRLKGALTGGDPTLIASSEWGRFSLLMSRGYIQYLRYYYFVKKSEQAGPQLSYYTDSVTDLFSYLGDMVRGKPGGVFTKQELQEILDAVTGLFSSIHFKPDFLDQFMKIKVLIFAGSSDNWTPDDFDRAKEKVIIFRSVAEQVLSFVQVYSLNWKPSDLSDVEAQKYFQSAADALVKSTTLLGSIFETDYDLADMSKLLDDLSAVWPDQNPDTGWIAQTQKYLPLVVSAKQLILQDQSTNVQRSKWSVLLNYTARTADQGLYFYYFVFPRPISTSPGLDYADQFFSGMSQLLSDIIDQRALRATRQSSLQVDGAITNDELVNLFVSLKTAEIFPAGITSDAISIAVKAVTGRLFFDPKKRLAGQVPVGFSKDSIAYLGNEFKIWSSTEHFLNQIYSDGVVGLPSAQLVHQLHLSSLEGAHELRGVISSSPSFVLDAKGRLHLGKVDQDYDLNSAGNLNFTRVLARLIIRGYIMDMDRLSDPEFGITVDELNSFYFDIKPLIVQFGLIQSDNMSFAKSRFFEANLFTPAADGNAYLNLNEASQVFAMILSGLNVNSLVVKSLAHQCIARAGATEAQDLMDVNCVIEFYRQNFSSFLDSMPDLAKYVSRISPEVFHQIGFAFLKSTGWAPTADNTALRSDVNLLPHVFQYSESLFQRFDLDKNGSIDDDEAAEAYPVYKTLIKTFSGTGINFINEAAFHYILKIGKVPCGLGDLKGFIGDIIVHRPVGIDDDRAAMANVFGSIADAVNGAKGTCPKKDAKSFQPPAGEVSPGDQSQDYSPSSIQNLMEFSPAPTKSVFQ